MTTDYAAVAESMAQSSPALTEHDHAILEQLPQALSGGLELYRWWQRTHAENGYRDRIPLVRQTHRPTDVNFGFLENVPLKRGLLPVLGIYQEQLYDAVKAPESQQPTELEWMRCQVQAYMLRYFMRVCAHCKPRPLAQGPKTPPPDFLKELSWCGGEKTEERGWGYSQLFYKLRETGKIGKFAEDEQRQIIDLREVGTKYEWVVFHTRVHHFALAVHLAGAAGPLLEVPLKEDVYTVMSREFVMNREHPSPGVRGEYGYGYAVIPDPSVKSIMAYGPTGLTTTFDTMWLRVMENGQIQAISAFVANQPTRLVNFDPVDWGFRLADLMSFGMASRLLGPLKRICDGVFPEVDPIFTFTRTANWLSAGLAADELCISKERVLKNIMALHMLETYHFLLGTVSAWKLVPDWLDTDNLPVWVTNPST